MKTNRKKQLILIAMLVVVMGLGVGFAAFSSTLNISSSATVTPSADDFKVLFSTTEYAIDTSNSTCKLMDAFNTIGDVSAGIGCVKSNSISQMITNFTEPGQNAQFRIYLHNTGNYDAYIESINIENATDSNTYKRCIASTNDSTKADDSLVAAACDDIHVIPLYNGNTMSFGERLEGIKIAPGETSYIELHVVYASEGDRADGDFDVYFGDISLEFTSKNTVRVIKGVSVAGEFFYYEDGMTWKEFIESSFNSNNALINEGDSYVSLHYNAICTDGYTFSPYDLIDENKSYGYCY